MCHPPQTPRHNLLILMGVVGKPHGVRGLVHVHSYAENPDSLARYPLRDDQNRAWSLIWRSEGVAELRDAQGHALASRTDAEKLTNTRLHVERSRLPAPDADEFYLADLVGLAAHTQTGEPVGQVTAVHDYGGGTSLEIDRPGTTPLLIPFTRAAVPEIDIRSGRLTVIPPDEIEIREVAA